MENIAAKKNFLKTAYVPLLRSLDPAAERRWGKMDVAQMIEHMTYSVRQANGKDIQVLQTPEEHLPRMQAFLESEKPFRENTPNKLLPEEPLAPRHTDREAALMELQQEIDEFFNVFNRDSGKRIMNPFFGSLNFDQWSQLLYKHAWHHLRQFGVEELNAGI